MAGTVTIHSSGGRSIADGHSWIEYLSDDRTVARVTYGTWGNNPRGLGNGLHANLELGRIGQTWRSAHIDDQQVKELFAKIGEYQARGEDAWNILHPCSAFAVAAWHAATGERLRHRKFLLFSNPSTLCKSLAAGRR
jgi:hypothetical protein